MKLFINNQHLPIVESEEIKMTPSSSSADNKDIPNINMDEIRDQLRKKKEMDDVSKFLP